MYSWLIDSAWQIESRRSFPGLLGDGDVWYSTRQSVCTLFKTLTIGCTWMGWQKPLRQQLVEHPLLQWAVHASAYKMDLRECYGHDCRTCSAKLTGYAQWRDFSFLVDAGGSRSVFRDFSTFAAALRILSLSRKLFISSCISGGSIS